MATTMTRNERLYTIALTFLSENTVAFCRLVISARRGCRQFPGLSAMTGVFFVGVLADLGGTRAVDDMIDVQLPMLGKIDYCRSSKERRDSGRCGDCRQELECLRS